MQNDFYTSTEVSQITGCSRRQLQYWRDKGVVVPTVNPSGKGRNVYYSVKELVALTVMNYLLSLGLSFELSVNILQMLREREAWMFTESLQQLNYKQWMIRLSLEDYSPELLDVDAAKSNMVLETISDGGIICLDSHKIYALLNRRLGNSKYF